MSEAANTPTPTATADRTPGFRPIRTFHPTLRTADLKQAERFYQSVFGVPIIPSELPAVSSCTVIRDVFFETVVPQLYVVDGVQRLPSIEEPHLYGFGWYVDDVPAAFQECRDRDIRLVNQFEEPLEGDELPAVASYRLFFTAKESTGMRYTIFPEMHLSMDPRTQEGWVLGPVSADDPLGIIASSHHTFLTARPDRALRFVVDALGGSVIHEGRNELLSTTSTYVYLAGAVLEYAIPDPGTPAHEDWARTIPSDTYHAIHWQVTDLEQAERHLVAQGARIQARTGDGFITDPSTTIGVTWGFSQTLVPGDPRRVTS